MSEKRHLSDDTEEICNKKICFDIGDNLPTDNPRAEPMQPRPIITNFEGNEELNREEQLLINHPSLRSDNPSVGPMQACPIITNVVEPMPACPIITNVEGNEELNREEQLLINHPSLRSDNPSVGPMQTFPIITNVVEPMPARPIITNVEGNEELNREEQLLINHPSLRSDNPSVGPMQTCPIITNVVEPMPACPIITNVEGNEELNREEQLLMDNPSLRSFDILDELSDQGSEYELQANSSDYDSEISDFPEDEIEAMLEAALPEEFQGVRRVKDKKLNEENRFDAAKLSKPIEKIVLEEIGHNHFDLLPEGWIQVMHSSGMPVYLHKLSRVCTMARPYYLGPGSSRKHKVPLNAVPCLQYRRALEVEKQLEEERRKKTEECQSRGEYLIPTARVETAEENEAMQSLEITDLREYCKKVFNFKTITIIPFQSWRERRKYAKLKKQERKRERPTLPDGTKLLKFPIQNPDGSNSRSKGEWIINPNGKSYVCILHEYVQNALKKQPTYEFKELENPATPYSATVFIGDIKYSTATGTSKKQAKVEAAKAALEVLIPEMREKIERDSQVGMKSGITKRSIMSDLSIFDEIKIEDPRVAEFCTKTTEPPPYAILMTCLQRNIGLGDVHINYEMNTSKKKEIEFTMTVGKHTAKVISKNKRDGKQRAAQAILQALHPNVKTWGSLLRLYGNQSVKNVKEKKQEEQEITTLQSKASLNQPNYAILDKLRQEMLKLSEKRATMEAKGKFTPPTTIILPSLSSTDLDKVNLK